MQILLGIKLISFQVLVVHKVLVHKSYHIDPVDKPYANPSKSLECSTRPTLYSNQHKGISYNARVKLCNFQEYMGMWFQLKSFLTKIYK